MTAFDRHDFVTLHADWREHFAASLAENAAQQIEAWRQASRPFVIASRRHGDAAEMLRLGLAGPGKTRLGFAVEAGAIATHIRPPLLAEIAAVMPQDWQETLATLHCVAAENSLTVRAYGSAAWAALTGLEYLTPTSDLDLSIEPQTGANLDGSLQAMAALSGPPRLDGEIRFTGVGDVNWREWLSQPERVLVRTRLGPRLIARAEAA